MNKRVLGIDISRNFAVCYCLETIPENPKSYFNSFDKVIVKRKKFSYKLQSESILLTNDLEGINLFKSLNPTHVVLEPTGYHYSIFWAIQAARLGAEVVWISHQGLNASRKHYGFRAKDDDIDAFCLALSYLDPATPRERYLKCYQYGNIQSVRDCYFERKRLIKARIKGTNQLRQFLCLEFPEIAERDMKYISKEGFNLTLGFIAGLHKGRKVPNQTAGLGISVRSKNLAIEILNLQSRIEEQEAELESLLEVREYAPYMRVFNRFGFGLDISALLLTRIYPIEKFYTDGKIKKDDNNRDLSLRQFQSYLGLGWTYERSGDTSAQNNRIKKRWGGSGLTRADLFVWLLANPVRQNRYQPQNSLQSLLKDTWIKERLIHRVSIENGEKVSSLVRSASLSQLGKDGICRFLFILTRMLWRELNKEIEAIDF